MLTFPALATFTVVFDHGNAVDMICFGGTILLGWCLANLHSQVAIRETFALYSGEERAQAIFRAIKTTKEQEKRK